MSKTKQIIYGVVGALLSASNAFAASNNGSSSYNLGNMYDVLVSGVDKTFQTPLTWVYSNLAHLFLAIPILVIMIIVITKSGIFGGHGRDASQVAQGE